MKLGQNEEVYFLLRAKEAMKVWQYLIHLSPFQTMPSTCLLKNKHDWYCPNVLFLSFLYFFYYACMLSHRNSICSLSQLSRWPPSIIPAKCINAMANLAASLYWDHFASQFDFAEPGTTLQKCKPKMYTHIFLSLPHDLWKGTASRMHGNVTMATDLSIRVNVWRWGWISVVKPYIDVVPLPYLLDPNVGHGSIFSFMWGSLVKLQLIEWLTHLLEMASIPNLTKTKFWHKQNARLRCISKIPPPSPPAPACSPSCCPPPLPLHS